MEHRESVQGVGGRGEMARLGREVDRMAKVRGTFEREQVEVVQRLMDMQMMQQVMASRANEMRGGGDDDGRKVREGKEEKLGLEVEVEVRRGMLWVKEVTNWGEMQLQVRLREMIHLASHRGTRKGVKVDLRQFHQVIRMQLRMRHSTIFPIHQVIRLIQQRGMQGFSD